MGTFEIAGGDDACYGPRFGPWTVETVGVVGDSDAGHLLLALPHPAQVDGAMVEVLAVRPRYVGVTLQDLLREGGTVGIWRVLPGRLTDLASGITPDNAEYWAIGTCVMLPLAQPTVQRDGPASGGSTR